jgi:ketosteroid isomerase-like protein
MRTTFRRKVILVLALIALVVPVARAQAPSAAEQALITIENQWAEATLKGDVQTLDRLYSDEYFAVSADGTTYTKAQHLADIKSGNFKLATYKLDELKVRLHGEVAVVTGRNTMTGTYMGKDISGAYRFTDVFVKRGGRWQVLTTQATLVATK